MRAGLDIERAVGIEYYASDAPGTGGRLRAEPSAFRVRELEAIDPQPLDGDPADYPHLLCRVTLENWDTNDFAHELSARLGISRERINWAGTKDKRAVSTQLFSIRTKDQTMPELPGVEIDILGRYGRALQFGDLWGNAFDITVAEPTAPEQADAISEILSSLAPEDLDATWESVPNYFGHQRFGSRRPITHRVGLAIIDGDWERAVMTYLGSPHEREPAATQRARSLVDDGEWEDAMAAFPDGLRFERALLDALLSAREYDDQTYQDALDRLPDSLQRLFVHAAQSYCFNKMVSKRLERGYPFSRPIVGDRVCFLEAEGPDDVLVPDVERGQVVTEARLQTIERHCDRARAMVTFPLVGMETDLPTGDPGEIVHDVLEDVDLERADFDLMEPYTSSGTHRAIAVTTTATRGESPLSFSFSLPRGSYASVYLREYLKVDPDRL